MWSFFLVMQSNRVEKRGRKYMEILEHIIEFVIEVVVPILELMGIFIVVEAAVVSFAKYLYWLFTGGKLHVKGHLAVGLLLGLEFMMTAEILKTIVIREVTELLILGGVVILRGILGLELKKEEKEEREEDREEWESSSHK